MPSSSRVTIGESPSLEEFGYHEEFERTIKRFASFAIAFSFISITTGIFTSYGSVLTSSGPRGIWTWAAVTVGVLCVALVFGLFAARVPVTGYAYQWMSRLANPTIGWLIGWFSFAFLVVDVVAVDYALASTVLPSLFSYTGTATNAWLATGIVIFMQALLIMFSTSLSARINSIAVGTEVVGIVGLTLLLLVIGAIKGDLHWGHLFSTGTVSEHGWWDYGSFRHAGPLVLAFLLGSFTIVGFESAANLAEETEEPHRVVPRSMWTAVLLSGVIGMAFLIAVTAASGDLAALTSSGTPVADVIEHILGSVVGKIFLVFVTYSIFACGLVIFITCVRVTWAMSRDERFPGAAAWRRVHPRLGTPLLATVLVGLVIEIVLAAFANRQDALFKLFSAATLMPCLIYIATVILYVFTRRRLPHHANAFSLGRFEIPVVVLALIWLLFELSIFRDASFNDPWIYIGVMFGIGLVYLAWLLVSRRKRGLQMPSSVSIDRALDEAAQR